MSDLGKLIRKVRKKRKLKLKDVAQAINKSPAYICDLEHGRRGNNINPIIVSQLADYLHIPTSLMFKKAGLIDDEGVIEYNQYLKVTRSKRKARKIAASFEHITGLLHDLKRDTQNLAPMVHDEVKALETSVRELQTIISVG